jgi:phage gpG-like protein
MSKFNFKQVIQNIEQVKKELPPLLANDAQKYFLGAFKDESWNGNKWEEVNRRIEGTREYKYPLKKGLSRHDKKILIGTGRLRRQVSLLAGNAKVTHDRYNFTVRLILDDSIVPYGKYHNTGGEHLPQRKFMGDTPALRRILRKRIDTYFDKIWQTKAA